MRARDPKKVAISVALWRRVRRGAVSLALTPLFALGLWGWFVGTGAVALAWALALAAPWILPMGAGALSWVIAGAAGAGLAGWWARERSGLADLWRERRALGGGALGAERALRACLTPGVALGLSVRAALEGEEKSPAPAGATDWGVLSSWQARLWRRAPRVAASGALALAGWASALALAPLAMVESWVGDRWRGAGRGRARRMASWGVMGVVSGVGAMLASGVGPLMAMVWSGAGLRAGAAALGLAFLVMMGLATRLPGMFGAGWWKRPGREFSRGLVGLAEEFGLGAFAWWEAWWDKMRLGKEAGAMAGAARGAPAVWGKSLGIFAAALAMMIAIPVWMAEEALGLAWRWSSAVAGGRVPGMIKAGMSALEKEGSADFAKAESVALAEAVKKEGGLRRGRRGAARL